VVTELHVDDDIELQAVLKVLSWVESGGAAKRAIQRGEVTVNGEVETRRARRCAPGDVISYRGHVARVAR
jgi:ribosome-associated protein